jgi:hypothetical protein
VVLAEIELADAGQEFALPDWIGAEVTSDPRYRKVNMMADHVANQKSADTALLARADEVHGMKRREFITLLGGGGGVAPRGTRAAAGKDPAYRHH